MNALVASRILPDEVRSLRNREYHVMHGDDRAIRPVDTADDLHRLLTQELGLAVSREECQRLFDDTAGSTDDREIPS